MTDNAKVCFFVGLGLGALELAMGGNYRGALIAFVLGVSVTYVIRGVLRAN